MRRHLPILDIEISTYKPDEIEENEWEFYIDINVPVPNTSELISLWNDLLDYISISLGEDALKKYSIHLSKGR